MLRTYKICSSTVKLFRVTLFRVISSVKPNNKILAFHNVLELIFHKIVKHEGNSLVRLLTKMYSKTNMKIKSNTNGKKENFET